MGLGFRVAIELVVCTVVGAGLGYGFDVWLGSRPFGMVIGLGFGFAAGVTTIYRVVKGMDEAVGLGRASRERETRQNPPAKD
jgi:ATP synthase protein I